MSETLGVIILIALLTPIMLSTLGGLVLVGIAIAGRMTAKTEASAMSHSHTG
jgi:hypothetical protein